MIARAARVAPAGISALLHARAFTSIPVVDVSPLVSHAQDERAVKRVGDELHAACRDVGFFYVSNHGVPREVSEGVLEEARAWFALPMAEKQRIALSPTSHYRGYQALGANVTRYDGGFQRDWHEAIDLYKEVDARQLQVLPHSPIHGPNPWPEQRPSFAAALRDYVAHMSSLGASLLRGIAAGLDLPLNFFDGDVAGPRDAYWCMRVIHYPPLREGSVHAAATGSSAQVAGVQQALQGAEVDRAVQLSCGEHTDYGLLTLVNQQEGISALQVKNAAGEWIDAVPLPGTFVCNIGDMFKVWTNGLYKPTAHRVINADPARARVSLPFFYEPCFETRVAPAPQLCAGAPPRFPPVRYGSHLESKVLNNFELN